MFLLTVLTFSQTSINISNKSQTENYKNNTHYIEIIQANNYLNNILGLDFVSKNLKFDTIITDRHLVAIYETTNTKNLDGKNTILVWFKFHNLRYEIDSINTVLDKKEIIKNIKGKKCNLFIGLKKAKEIAEKAGLESGIKNWNIYLTYQNNFPIWVIQSTYGESKEGAYRASGQLVKINMIDGSFDKNDWDAIE